MSPYLAWFDEIPDEELAKMKTVGDIVNYLEAHA